MELHTLSDGQLQLAPIRAHFVAFGELRQRFEFGTVGEQSVPDAERHIGNWNRELVRVKIGDITQNANPERASAARACACRTACT